MLHTVVADGPALCDLLGFRHQTGYHSVFGTMVSGQTEEGGRTVRFKGYASPQNVRCTAFEALWPTKVRVTGSLHAGHPSALLTETDLRAAWHVVHRGPEKVGLRWVSPLLSRWGAIPIREFPFTGLLHKLVYREGKEFLVWVLDPKSAALLQGGMDLLKDRAARFLVHPSMELNVDKVFDVKFSLKVCVLNIIETVFAVSYEVLFIRVVVQTCPFENVA